MKPIIVETWKPTHTYQNFLSVISENIVFAYLCACVVCLCMCFVRVCVFICVHTCVLCVLHIVCISICAYVQHSCNH